MDSGIVHRSHSSQTAEVCRLCLRKNHLVDIGTNQHLRMQLMQCFPHQPPEDNELPRFVCTECCEQINITYQFFIRTRRSELLLRTFVYMGGDFPSAEMLEPERRRTEKRSASPQKESQNENLSSKKRRSSEGSSKDERSEKKTSKHREEKRESPKHKEEGGQKPPKHIGQEKDSSRHKHKRDRPSVSERKDQEEQTERKRSSTGMNETDLKRYYLSDEYLFGEKIELESTGKQNDPSGKFQKEVRMKLSRVI
ncbi:hypothetical protein RP20_CCG006262 [Aedes albopictus]|nr:hypothetical protein RP20_CCG006262 [Aedes albopictus]